MRIPLPSSAPIPLPSPLPSSLHTRYDDHILQLFTSSLFLAGAFTALVGMFTCRKIGRRATMCMGGAAFIIGTVLVASAFHVAQLVIGRLILGVGVGFATQVRGLGQGVWLMNGWCG